MKIKVLLINPTYPPTKCGMADYCRKLAKYFNKHLNVEMFVLTTIIGNKKQVYFDENVKIYAIMEKWNISEAKQLAILIHNKKPHIIHIQYHENDFPSTKLINFLPIFMRYTKRIYYNTKVVCSMAGFEFKDKLNFFQKLMVKYSDSIVVTTDEDKEKLNYLNNIHCIYDGANITTENNYKKDFSINKKLKILFFGFINKEKGLHHLFSAISLLKDKIDLKLIVVGELHDEIKDNTKIRSYHNYLKKRMKLLEIEDNIEFTGYVEENKLSDIFTDCDISVIPFTKGIMGKRSSFWSILDHGIPSITTIGKNKLKNIENNENVILVERELSVSIAQGIELLYNNKRLRKKIGQNGRKLVREYFSWKNIAESLLKVYKEIIF